RPHPPLWRSSRSDEPATPPVSPHWLLLRSCAVRRNRLPWAFDSPSLFVTRSVVHNARGANLFRTAHVAMGLCLIDAEIARPFAPAADVCSATPSGVCAERTARTVRTACGSRGNAPHRGEFGCSARNCWHPGNCRDYGGAMADLELV